MTTLLLVRHGQSEANLLGLYSGHSHFRLTEYGKKQADCAAEYIAEKYNVEKIYSSDQLRAYDTACSLSTKLDMMEVTSDARLREIFSGDWEGREFSELAVTYADEFEKWRTDIGTCRIPGGESMVEMNDRIVGVLSEIAEKNIGKTVAVFFHSTPIRGFCAYCRDGSLDKMHELPWPSNASVTVAEYDGKNFKITDFSNDTFLENTEEEKE